MFSLNIWQRNPQKQIQNYPSRAKSTFQAINGPFNMLGLEEERKKNSSVQQKIIYREKLIHKTQATYKYQDTDFWDKVEIQMLFKLYNYYGPQWKIISGHMPLRTANNLKNRFYTVIRNLVKMLFRIKVDVCPRMSGQLHSKDLARLYDGRQCYIQFQSVIKNILEEIEFDLNSKKIETVAENYSQSIIEIYKIIYADRITASEERTRQSQRNPCQPNPNVTVSTNILIQDQQLLKINYQQTNSLDYSGLQLIYYLPHVGYFYCVLLDSVQFP